MRDEFGEIDPDEVDVIDFIEPDASAFGADGDDAAEPDVGGDHRRRWLVPTAIVSAVGLAAAGVFALAPWREDDTRSFPESSTPELTLTEQLVFDHPPAELTSASLGQNSEEGFGFTSFADDEGYFFAEPGVSWNIFGGQSNGTWAAFFATAPDSENAPDLSGAEDGTAGTVQGAPAVIAQPQNGLREITFGPVDGLIFSVVTSGMSLADSTAFAEAVGVDDDIPTIADQTVLGDMDPIGDIADYGVALSTVFGSTSVFAEQTGVVSVHYGNFLEDLGGDAYSIATQPVLSGSTMALLQFAFGGEVGKAVHDQPAVLIDGQDGAFAFGDGQFTSAVAWIEGGRLIVVAGPDDIAATVALAESVRPATEDEWAAVVETVRNSVDPSIPLFPDDNAG